MGATEAIHFAALIAVALACFCVLAGLFRLIGMNRTVFLNAVVIGVILGPTVGGRLLPEFYEQYVRGGSPERQAVTDLEVGYAQDRSALLAADVSPVALEEQEQRYDADVTAARIEYERAVSAHTLPRTAFIVFACMAAIGLHLPTRHLFHPGGSWNNAAFLCAWITITTTGAIALVAAYGFSSGLVPSAILGLTYALTSWSPDPKRCHVPTQQQTSEPSDESGNVTIERAGGLCWLLCLAVGLWCTLRLLPDADEQATQVGGWLLPVAGFAGAVIGMFIAAAGAGRWANIVSRLAACLAITTALVSIDLFYFGLWGPVLLALLVSGDARWLGAACGGRLIGFSWKPSFQHALLLTNAAVLQAAAGMLCHASHMLNDHLLLAAVFGAVMCDLTMRLRRLLTTYPLSHGPGEEDPASQQQPAGDRPGTRDTRRDEGEAP